MASVAKKGEEHALSVSTDLWHQVQDRGWKIDNDESSWETACRVVEDNRADVLDHWSISNEQHALELGRLSALWSMKWVNEGAVILETTEEYAAALACTKTSKDVAKDIRLPASAFLVRLPFGLYPSGALKDDAKWVTQVRCLNAGSHSYITLHTSAGRRGMLIEPPSVPPISLADMLFDEEEISIAAVDEAIAEETAARGGYRIDLLMLRRSMTMIRRTVSGLLYTLTHTTDWRNRGEPSGNAQIKRHGPPKHRRIVIGRPVSVNMAHAVRGAIQNGGSSPAYQTMTRGHYRRQVVGVGGLGRKVIWIEPYWRGPEDAPILTRPYRVGVRKEMENGCNGQ
jgi:hypothetical protein